MTPTIPREPELSIVIPAKNEAKRIGQTLDELAKFLKKLELEQAEVMVVVGKSDDDTPGAARAKANKFANLSVYEENSPGKGHAVQTGMLRAKGRYRLFMDADLATPLHHIEPTLKYLRGGTDIVIGQRDLSVIHKGLLRRLISMVGNLTVRILLGMTYKDTQCGFKAFRASVAEDLFAVQTTHGWGFDMELLAVARKRKYTVATIDINDWKDVAGGNLEGQAAQAALSTLKDVLNIRWNILRGRYKSRHESNIESD